MADNSVETMADNSVETMADNSVETMIRFPKASRKTSGRPTKVLWDMNDYPNPESLDPFSIAEKIKEVLWRDGYRGEPSITIYVADVDTFPEALQDKYLEAGIFTFNVSQGTNASTLKMMFVDILFGALSFQQSNVLILSINKNIAQDTNFIRLRKALVERGFSVVLTDPDTLMNLDVPNPFDERPVTEEPSRICVSCSKIKLSDWSPKDVCVYLSGSAPLPEEPAPEEPN